MMMNIVLATGNYDSVIIGVVSALVVGLIMQIGERKRTAGEILSKAKKILRKPHTYRAVGSPSEFSHLDLAYYDRVEGQLAKMGFVMLGDFENMTVGRNLNGVRMMIRRMVGEDGAVTAEIYHLKRRGAWRLIKKVDGLEETRCVELVTEFTDGTFLLTSNIRTKTSFLDFGPKYQNVHYPQITDIRQLFELHHQRTYLYQTEHPDVAAVLIRDHVEFEACGQRQRETMAAWRDAIGWKPTPDEVRKFSGKPAKESNRDRTVTGTAKPAAGVIKPQQPVAGPMRPVTTSPARAMADQPAADFELSAAEGESAAALDDPAEQWYPAVREEMVKKLNPKRSLMGNLVILAVTLFLFFGVGKVQFGLQSVLIIIGVLLVHEMGHFAWMKIFGYRDVRMFFIPLFGAAVSGRDHAISDSKKAIVSLMGPLPGIVISYVFWILYGATQAPIYRELGLMFLVLNGFNLLPIVPLDGGRFLEDLLFSRNRYLEVVGKVFAAIVLIGIGIAQESWVLGLLGVLTLISIPMQFRIATIAGEYKREHPTPAEAVEAESGSLISPDDVPESSAKMILGRLIVSFSNKLNAATLADTVLGVWKRVHRKPAGVFSTVGLMLLFLLSYVLIFFSLGAGVLVHRDDIDMPKTKIVQYQDDQGRTRYKQQTTWMMRVLGEIELSDDQQLYHGRVVYYDGKGKIGVEGRWDMGRKVGEWKYYNYKTGEVATIEVYNQGRLVCKKTNVDGQWTQKAFEDMSAEEKQGYQTLIDSPPKGPNSINDDDDESLDESEADESAASEPVSSEQPATDQPKADPPATDSTATQQPASVPARTDAGAR